VSQSGGFDPPYTPSFLSFLIFSAKNRNFPKFLNSFRFFTLNKSTRSSEIILFDIYSWAGHKTINNRSIWQDLSMDTKRFNLVTLALVFDLHIDNFNHSYMLWLVCTKTLICHMSVCCDKSFQWIPTGLTLWPWSLCLTLGKLNLRSISWMVCIRSLIFHMNVPWDKTFQWVLTDTALPLAAVWCLTYILKTLTLAIKFWIVCTRT
jgi:hypothetical protein